MCPVFPDQVHEDKGRILALLKYLFLEKGDIVSCVACVLHLQAPQRTVIEREFILSEKDFFHYSIFLFFFFSLKKSIV